MSPPPPRELEIHDLATPLPQGATLIEASAGTGKTYTIAAIFLRLIVEEKLRAEEILVTTFTIPATAELRERIRSALRRAWEAFHTGVAQDELSKALLERHREDAAEIARRLEDELHEFDPGRISTIHGFCQRVLSECAFESGAAPETEFVTDEREWIGEVALDFWRREFYECAACLIGAAQAGSLSLRALRQLLAAILQKPLAKIIPPFDEARLEAARAQLRETFAALRACWRESGQELERLLITDNDWSKLPYSDEEFVRLHLAAVGACLDSEAERLFGYSSLAIFSETAIAKGVCSGGVAPQHRFCELCEELHGSAQKYRSELEAKFLHWAPEELLARKTKANVTGFSDLLVRLRAELCSERGPALAASLRKKYRAALIDEFQDTDAVQESIFQQIFVGAEKSWLFLIGDPKQAIYAFRGADVFSYLAAARKAERRLTLRTNFRSTHALVQGVNAVFESHKRAFVVEGIGFDPATASGQQEKRAFAGDGVAAPLRLWLWQGEAKTSEEAIREELARAAAGEILRLLEGGGRLGTEPVRAQDIAVLTTSNKEAGLMQAELQRAGVPAVVLTSGSVFDSREARELWALLAALAEPGDERLVRGALLTELLGLRLSDLQAFSAETRRWEEWLQRFAAWQEVWQRAGFSAALRRAMWQLHLRVAAASREDGERRLTNLAQLAELIQQAVTEEQLGPAATVEWLGRRVTEAAGQERAQAEEHELRLERDDEAVRVVTVHKSKGLQYDIVFCPFSWRSTTRRGDAQKPHAIFHEADGGVVLDLGSDDLAAHLQQEQAERLAEEVRALYVALTRARARCDVALPFKKSTFDSAAAWLLQATPPEYAGKVDEISDFHAGLTPAQWEANLRALEVRAADSIALTAVPAPAAGRLKRAVQRAVRGQPEVFGGQIERDFCVSSFSSLTEGAQADLPEAYLPPADEEPETEPGRDDIHAFPAGARSGLCLHEIFESLDFVAQAGLDELVARKLDDFSLEAARWRPAVAGCLRQVLAAPLPGGFKLSDIRAEARLQETEFHLPAGRLEAPALRRVLGEGDEPGGLEFTARRGWLKGVIDLVFRHDGRYYVADWKSNRLGRGPAAYGGEGVRAAMRSHHYGLQAHLYALALHRYLRGRLLGYDYERHFGGMYYFFVRGADVTRPELGLWTDRPSLEKITALERWLEGAP